MATPIELPQFGNTVEECIITRWVKQKGDVVAAGDLVAEIETDKTTFEITAPVDGTLLETFFDEGALVPVFTKICVIGDAGESVDAFRPLEGAESAGGAEGSEGGAESARPSAQPAPSAPLAPAAPSDRAAWSPRARRFAAGRDVHTEAVRGSGPKGRVLEQDVRRALSSSSSHPSPKSPKSPIRQVIARRMRESLASTAQYTMHASANATGLLAVRALAKARADTSDVNINDLVAYCTVQALLQTPALNAEFIDGEIITHGHIHVGFACDTPRGLIVPVVRNAHTLSLRDLSTRMKTLAAQAVEGNISPDDLSGGTFTISNLGGLGIETFTPLINPPQVAILGVGAIQLKPVRSSDKVDIVDTIGLSLTCDHQVIDGAPGARFLQTVKKTIENVEAICRNQLS
jgi:pyruvate dehydrogenase E2 component (dihydrolipoamide acetyltransferase)